MAEEKSGLKLLLYGVIVVILLYGLIKIFVHTSGNFFALELLGFVVLLLLSVFGFIGYASNWGERVLFLVFVLYLVNVAMVWSHQRSLYVVLLIIGVIGFLFTIPKARVTEEKNEIIAEEVEEPHSMVFDTKPVIAKTTVVPKRASVKHSPGKFLASQRSNIYHEPKCEWAKKIGAQRRVWFKNKEAAWEDGYRAHSCI